MHTIVKTSVIASALLVAVAGCGSKTNASGMDPGDAVVGEWNGKCSTVKDQDGSRVTDDVKANLRFTQDGKYFHSIAGHGELAGNYTVAGQTITVTSNGVSVKIDYSIKGGILRTRTRAKLGDVPVTSTCAFRQGAGR
jgi:heat shock protein HslJ